VLSSDVFYSSYTLISVTIISAMTDLLEDAAESADASAAASIDWFRVFPTSISVDGTVQSFIKLFIFIIISAATKKDTVHTEFFASHGTILPAGARIYAESLADAMIDHAVHTVAAPVRNRVGRMIYLPHTVVERRLALPAAASRVPPPAGPVFTPPGVHNLGKLICLRRCALAYHRPAPPPPPTPPALGSPAPTRSPPTHPTPSSLAPMTCSLPTPYSTPTCSPSARLTPTRSTPTCSPPAPLRRCLAGPAPLAASTSGSLHANTSRPERSVTYLRPERGADQPSTAIPMAFPPGLSTRSRPGFFSKFNATWRGLSTGSSRTTISPTSSTTMPTAWVSPCLS